MSTRSRMTGWRATWLLLAAGMILGISSTASAAEHATEPGFYDESAYTEYVESMMAKLDQLYLDYVKARGVDAPAAAKAEKEFLVNVHELMKRMNEKFDSLDPKAGAALSATEILVSVHAHTMLIDILATNQMEHISKHPFIE